MNGSPQKRLHFDQIILDPINCRLHGPNGEIELRPQTFEFLHHLIRRSGQLVTKEELFAAIWPKTVVTDDSLVQCVKEIRSKLGDEIIRTVPRRGYVFTRPVQERDSAPTPGVTTYVLPPPAENFPPTESAIRVLYQTATKSVRLPKIDGTLIQYSNDEMADYPSFDLVVLDINIFPPLEALQDRYLTSTLPAVVIIVDTIEQESAVLAWLRTGDETCRREAIKHQFSYRFRRSLSQFFHIRGRQLPTLSMIGQLPMIDGLTGLLSATGLRKYGEELLLASSASDPAACLILLDLDRFKTINDRLGHQAGDQILASTGELLKQYAQGAGITGRLAGDEFAILIPGGLEQGRALAGFLREQIESHEFKLEGGASARITVSLGIAAAGANASVEQLLQQADHCLYTAKSQGRNRIVTTEQLDVTANESDQDASLTALENRMRVTIERMTNDLINRTRRVAGQYRMEAHRDALTGIFNRRHLDRLLHRELETYKKNGKKVTIVLLDLDHFGAINKTYGFPSGDRALKMAAAVLQESVRPLDTVARYGGEEFGIVMPDTDLKTGCRVAERILSTLRAQSVEAYNGPQIQITASIGVVELSADDQDLISLYQRASDKVFKAKQNGRDRVQC